MRTPFSLLLCTVTALRTPVLRRGAPLRSSLAALDRSSIKTFDRAAPLAAAAPEASADDSATPVASLRVLYPVSGAATATAWTLCAIAACDGAPLAVARALTPLPLLYATVDALRSAAAAGRGRLASVTYRRLNLGLAAASLWLGAGALASVDAGPLALGASAAHFGTASIAAAAWHGAVGSPAPRAALTRVLRGVGGSAVNAVPWGVSALADPESVEASDGRLGYGALSAAFGVAALVSAAAPPPLAVYAGGAAPLAYGGHAVLAAAATYALKDAAERGRSDASTFRTLRGGLKTALAWHVAATLLRTLRSGGAGVLRADRFGALAAAAFLLAFPRRALV